MDRKELDYYKEIFFHLNYSYTGQLTRDELLTGFWKNGYKDMNYFTIDTILCQIDADNSGQVSFDEFLITIVDPIKMLTRKKVAQAFGDIDIDRSGGLSIKNLNDFLCPDVLVHADTWR